MHLARTFVISAEDGVLDEWAGGELILTLGPITITTIGWTSDKKWILLATLDLELVPVPAGDTIDLAGPDLDILDAEVGAFADRLVASRARPIRVSMIAPAIGIIGDPSEVAPLAGLSPGPARPTSDVS